MKIKTSAKWLLGLILVVPLCMQNVANGSEYCPPPGYPDYPIECIDYDLGYWWCCPEDYPICGEGEDAGNCFQNGPTTTTAPSSATTTISGDPTTTTIPGTTDGNDFVVGININGEDAPNTESSGTLSGTSPSVVLPLLYRKDGRPIPLWHDRIFPPIEPILLEQTREMLKEKKDLQILKIEPYSIGDQAQFWVKDDRDLIWRQVSATVKKESTHSNIFVEDSLSIPDATLELYAIEFEIMYDVVANNIGVFSDRNGDGKVAILLYDMNDGGNINGYMGGYFWSKDYVEDSLARMQGIRSNELDIIYIRGKKPIGWEQLGGDFFEYNLTTLVHEYQHLVHFGIKVWTQGNNGDFSDVWIDEMMAMASETMYFKHKLQADSSFTHPSMEGAGYLADRIAYYNMDPQNNIRNGHGLTYWDTNGDVFSNYSLSYIFGQYLATHSETGQDIFRAILDYMIANSVHDYRGVVGAATQKISGISSWEDLLKNFGIANMSNQANGLFGYNGAFILTPHGPTSNKVYIHNSSFVYRKISGQWTAPPDAGPNIRFYTFDTSGSIATTTVSDEDSGCLTSDILGKDTNEVNLIRDFRDEVLRNSPVGEELIELYYQHTAELASIMIRNRDIRSSIQSLIISSLPAIEAAIENRRITISHDVIQLLYKTCDAISGEANSDLAEAIEMLQNKFNQGNLLSELGIGRIK